MSHPKPSEKRKGLGAGIIAFGVVFALFSLLFRPHTVGAFALATALSLFAGAVIRVMAQGLDVSPTGQHRRSRCGRAAGKRARHDRGNPRGKRPHSRFLPLR